METLAAILWAVCAALGAWYAADMAGRVAYVDFADGRRQAKRMPILFRLALPFTPNLRRFVSRPGFDKAREAVRIKLVSAGYDGVLSPNDFLALRFLVPVAGGILWSLFVILCASISPDSLLSANASLFCILGFLLLAVQPKMWLDREVKKRHFAIMRALPFVLDLLTLSVEAGMDFMSALQRNCRSRKLDPLNEELLRMTHEIQLGTSRRTALKNMAERSRQPDLKAVAFALVQADELGVSIGSILRIQSDQLRSRRFDRAEKLANEAPVKMLGPLLLFIFPAVLIILLSPILMQVAGAVG